MGKKNKAARKARKHARRKADQERELQTLQAKSPKAKKAPTTANRPRIGPNVSVANNNQRPRYRENQSCYHLQMSWCISQADREGEWTWFEPRDWTENEWSSTIKPGFEAMENLTWAEIDKQSSGSEHKMHHSQEISTLIREARDRWKNLGLEEFETLFRFRIGGQKRRAWGYRAQGHFFFVWWDREHSLYPTQKK